MDVLRVVRVNAADVQHQQRVLAAALVAVHAPAPSPNPHAELSERLLHVLHPVLCDFALPRGCGPNPQLSLVGCARVCVDPYAKQAANSCLASLPSSLPPSLASSLSPSSLRPSLPPSLPPPSSVLPFSLPPYLPPSPCHPFLRPSLPPTLPRSLPSSPPTCNSFSNPLQPLLIPRTSFWGSLQPLSPVLPPSPRPFFYSPLVRYS